MQPILYIKPTESSESSESSFIFAFPTYNPPYPQCWQRFLNSLTMEIDDTFSPFCFQNIL